MNRPLGITLTSLYSGLFGAFTFLIGSLGILVASKPSMPSILLPLAALLSLVGVLDIAIAYGLWTFQSWGHRTARWTYIAFVPLGILAIFPIFPEQQMSLGNTIYQLFFAALHLVIVIYLSKPSLSCLYVAKNKSASVVHRQPSGTDA